MVTENGKDPKMKRQRFAKSLGHINFNLLFMLDPIPQSSQGQY